MLKRLKERWAITSNLQLLIIFFVFSVTGSLSVMVRTPIFEAMGINSETNIFLKIILSILIITPSYQILLLIVGTLLGQFQFFWNFEKKMWSRFSKKKRTN